MTIHIAPFDPHTASDQLWTAFNETRRAIACEFWPDEPVLDDAETRREVETTGGVQPWRRELVFMPHLRHSPTAVRPSQLAGDLPFRIYPAREALVS